MKKHLSIFSTFTLFSYIVISPFSFEVKATEAFACLTEDQFPGYKVKEAPIPPEVGPFLAAECEQRCFQKIGLEKEYWIVKDDNHNFFVRATKNLISPKNEWLSNTEAPQFVKYCGPLAKDDFAVIEKWLTLKNVKYFIITERGKNREYDIFDLIFDKYLPNLGEENTLNTNDAININDIYKIIWLSSPEAFGYTGDAIPWDWVESHRKYYLQSGHYED